MEGMPYKRTKIEKEKKRELEKLVLRTISPKIVEIEKENKEPQITTSNYNVAYDQLLCNVNFRVYVVQNLDRNGLPY